MKTTLTETQYKELLTIFDCVIPEATIEIIINNVKEEISPTEGKTMQWLYHQKFFAQTRIRSDDVHFCRERHEKKEICEKLGITHFVDDRLEVLSYLIGTVPVGDIFTDPGETANDTVDGDISNNIVTNGSVDTNTPGSYLITYTVADSLGSHTSVTRTVIVSGTATEEDDTDDDILTNILPTPAASNITETVSQPITSPVSDVITFSTVAASTVTPVPVSSMNSSPAVSSPIKHSSSSSPNTFTAIDPYINDPAIEALRHRLIALTPSTTVVSIGYSLDGTLMHTSTTFPDTWKFNTAAVSNGAHNLTIVYHYKNGSTQTSITILTIQNGSTSINNVTTILGNIWAQLKEDLAKI